MSDTPWIPAGKDKTPRSYATEPPRPERHSPMPPGVAVKPAAIVLKHNVFVVSVAAMVITSLVTFFIPLFNGLVGGLFGGFHAGRMKRALAAAAASSVMVPAILGFGLFIAKNPEFYLFSGLGFGGWMALHVIGTFIGAISGAVARPFFTERTLYRSRGVSAAPPPGTGAAPGRSGSGTPAVPPSEPVREA